MLIDFGESYDLRQVERHPDIAKKIGNIAFLAPEVLLSADLLTQSFLDLEKINFSVQAID